MPGRLLPSSRRGSSRPPTETNATRTTPAGAPSRWRSPARRSRRRAGAAAPRRAGTSTCSSTAPPAARRTASSPRRRGSPTSAAARRSRDAMRFRAKSATTPAESSRERRRSSWKRSGKAETTTIRTTDGERGRHRGHGRSAMRTKTVFLLLSTVLAFPAAAQTRAPSGRAWSLLGGETVGADADVVSAELGWPGISFAFTHGTGRDSDVGIRFDLLYGVEQMSNTSQFGIGARVPLRLTVARRDRISVLVHIDPGLKLYTFSPAWFGLALPIGVPFGSAAAGDLTVAFGVDLPMTLFLTPTPVAFFIAPSFGPAVEYHVDPRLAVGINTRFGPVVRTAYPGVPSAFSTSGSQFGFVTQLMLGYRM